MALTPDATYQDTISYYRGEVIAVDGTYVYLITYWKSSEPYRLVKIDRATMLYVDSYYLPDAYSVSGSIISICLTGGFLYAATWQDPIIIYKINVSTMALASKTTLAAGQKYSRGPCTDGTYLYVGNALADPGEIYKIDLSTMAVVATWTSGTGLKGVAKLYHDGTYLYAGFQNVAFKATVAQIDPTTMTDVAQWTEASGTYYNAFCVTGDGTFIYAGLDTNPHQVYKINPSGMSEVSHYSNGSCRNCYAVTYNNQYVVSASRTYSPDMMYIVPATMTLFDSYTGTGADEYRDVAFDGDAVYLCKRSTPGYVFRFGELAAPGAGGNLPGGLVAGAFI